MFCRSIFCWGEQCRVAAWRHSNWWAIALEKKKNVKGILFLWSASFIYLWDIKRHKMQWGWKINSLKPWGNLQCNFFGPNWIIKKKKKKKKRWVTWFMRKETNLEIYSASLFHNSQISFHLNSPIIAERRPLKRVESWNKIAKKL